MNGRQYHWTERKQGQSGGAIGRVELNNFLFTFRGHLTASDNKCVRNPIQSESKSESETNTNICSEQTVAAEPSVIGIMMNTGEEYPITQSYVLELAELYPAVDIMQELRAMKGWCDANPRKRKTAGGMKRFINAWISKVQNRGGTPGYTQSYNQTAGGSKVERFAQGAREWANE